MRKIALLLPLLLLAFMVNAQKTSIDDLFEKYSGREGFTTVLVTEDMFKVVAHMEESSGELEGVLGKISRVRVLAQEDDFPAAEKVNFMNELKGVKFSDYKELVVVKESDQDVLVLAKEEDGKMRELLVVVSGDDNVLVSVEGKFSMEDLEGLSGLDGLDALGDILH